MATKAISILIAVVVVDAVVFVAKAMAMLMLPPHHLPSTAVVQYLSLGRH